MPGKELETVTVVVKDGDPVDVIGGRDDTAEMVELWLPSSEKRRLEAKIEELQEQVRKHARDETHWKVEYIMVKDRLENPHLYDNKGCPTDEALEKMEKKGVPIYGVPQEEPPERRRVVTIRERMLELGSAFGHRSRDESLGEEARAAWKRAYAELVVLRHHGMERPDLPLCLKCGGLGSAFPDEYEWKETSKGNPRGELRDGRPMVQMRKSCTCESGFDPDADINDVIDD